MVGCEFELRIAIVKPFILDFLINISTRNNNTNANLNGLGIAVIILIALDAIGKLPGMQPPRLETRT
jgi:hypothetical protein